MALLKITDASGRQWQYSFPAQGVCKIGRAPDNAVVIDDPRASRYHAHIKSEDGQFTIVDTWVSIPKYVVRFAKMIEYSVIWW